MAHRAVKPFGRRVHEPWSMAISRRLRQRYGFDGQVYAADDGIVIQLPDGDGHIPAQDLFLFDPEDLKADVERQVGESVLFAARFRECAARSLFMPRSDRAVACPYGSSDCAPHSSCNPHVWPRTFRFVGDCT